MPSTAADATSSDKTCPPSLQTTVSNGTVDDKLLVYQEKAKKVLDTLQRASRKYEICSRTGVRNWEQKEFDKSLNRTRNTVQAIESGAQTRRKAFENATQEFDAIKQICKQALSACSSGLKLDDGCDVWIAPTDSDPATAMESWEFLRDVLVSLDEVQALSDSLGENELEGAKDANRCD